MNRNLITTGAATLAVAAAVAVPATANAAESASFPHPTATIEFAHRVVTPGEADTATINLSTCMTRVTAYVHKPGSIAETPSTASRGSGTKAVVSFRIVKPGTEQVAEVWGQPCGKTGLEQVMPAHGTFTAAFTVTAPVGQAVASPAPGTTHYSTEGN